MGALTELLLDVAVFLIVVGAVMAGARALEGALAVRRRLNAAALQGHGPVVRGEKTLHPALRSVESLFLTKPEDRASLRSDLDQAGFESSSAPAWYVAIRFGLAVGLPLAFIAYNALVLHGQSMFARVILPLLLSGLALLLPRMIIRGRANSRRVVIENQFPDMLDLMLVCVEAGLGIEAAFQRVGRETAHSHPQISAELNKLSQELAAGRSRGEALRAFAGRLDVQAVKAFVALIIQTESLGVSVAQSLRTYASEMRESRYLKAEEKAMRIPVLMTIPLVACFMPVTVVALLLPTGIDIVRTVLPAMRMH